MYYAFIENGKINGCGQVRCLTEGVQNIEITEQQAGELDKYIYKNGEIILDPDYEAKQAQKAKEEHRKELIAQLDAIDLKCIRSLRAIQAADFTDEDVAKLQELEQQAARIRSELQNL